MSDVGVASASGSNANAVVPPPPRIVATYVPEFDTSNPQTAIKQMAKFISDLHADLLNLQEWYWDFYQATVVETGLLNPSEQATPESWDPSNLPNPAATTIANAQQTANVAYQFANAINVALATAAVTGFPITPPTPGA